MLNDKPVVEYAGVANFYKSIWTGTEHAQVYAIDHPYLGTQKIITSVVIKKNEDGSFETLNTVYIPWKKDDVAEQDD
jgi:hypothetical protein